MRSLWCSFSAVTNRCCYIAKNIICFFNLIFNLGRHKKPTIIYHTFLYNPATLQFVSHRDEKLVYALQ